MRTESAIVSCFERSLLINLKEVNADQKLTDSSLNYPDFTVDGHQLSLTHLIPANGLFPERCITAA